MKRMLLLLVGATFSLLVKAQTISKVVVGNTGAFEKVTFDVGEYVMLNLSKEGSIISWGIDHYLGQMENYQDKLDPYNGRVEYYGPNDNEAFRGKIKYMGRTYITYYASYDYEILRGKVKSIGNITLDYNQSFEDEAFRGNLKNIGQSAVTWYPSSENAALAGKLKSIGNTTLTYYPSFEDKAFRGKIKSIDRTSFTYYSSLERIEYRGAMKTGSTIIFANGIKYYVK